MEAVVAGGSSSHWEGFEEELVQAQLRLVGPEVVVAEVVQVVCEWASSSWGAKGLREEVFE